MKERKCERNSTDIHRTNEKEEEKNENINPAKEKNAENLKIVKCGYSVSGIFIFNIGTSDKQTSKQCRRCCPTHKVTWKVKENTKKDKEKVTRITNTEFILLFDDPDAGTLLLNKFLCAAIKMNNATREKIQLEVGAQQK